MLLVSNYKTFTKANTVRNHVQFLLNCLIKKKSPKVINDIHMIINGESPADSFQEISILDVLLNHTEHFIKDIDDVNKEKIHSEVLGVLEAFIAEQDAALQPAMMPRHC